MTIPRQRLGAVEPLTAAPVAALRLLGALDDNDVPADVIDLLALTPFADGDQPWARSVWLDNIRDDATLLPAGEPALLRRAVQGNRRSHLAGGDGWTLRAVRWSNGRGTVSVTAVTDELAERVLAEATTDVVQEPEEATEVSVGFWSRGAHGANRISRSIAAPTWAEIRRNYPAAAAVGLDAVMGADLDGLSGRIMLLHGPPGTGKTTALRALIREWRDDCQVDCVLDPEVLFSDPAYLLEVIVGEDDGDQWRMLLLEDCDELVRAGAKAIAGQALSRLLNLTDGLLGQGLKLLVGITTNEELSGLAPAVVRPGRCFAQIEVGRLSATEAAGWLGTPVGVPAGGASLAELVALKERREQVTVRQPPDHADDAAYL